MLACSPFTKIKLSRARKKGKELEKGKETDDAVWCLFSDVSFLLPTRFRLETCITPLFCLWHPLPLDSITSHTPTVTVTDGSHTHTHTTHHTLGHSFPFNTIQAGLPSPFSISTLDSPSQSGCTSSHHLPDLPFHQACLTLQSLPLALITLIAVAAV